MNFYLRFFFFVLGSIVLPHAYADEASYQLQIGDTIEIWVGQDQTLNRQVIIQPDGRISLPLAGHLRADGLTLEQLEAALAERFRGNFKNPVDLTVMLVSSPGQGLSPTVFLVGDVAAPGQYPFRRGMTVLHAISVAGGIYRPMSALSQLDPALAANTDVTLRRRLAGALLRSARLTAELADQSVMKQPLETSSMMQDTVVAHNARQEELLFEARRSFRGRELEARDRAQAAQRSQISALRSQLALKDTQKALALKEQASAKTLIDQGLSPASRGMSMERSIAEIDADRAQIESDLANAESSLAGGTTQGAGLEDERRLQLQGEQERTQAEAEEIQRILGITADAPAPAGSGQSGADEPDAYKYTILRTERGVLTELKADEFTPIQPGDLIRVRSLRGPSLGAISGIGALGLPGGENGDSVASVPATATIAPAD